MNREMEMETRLWEYIDGLSTTEEKGVIEQLLASQAEWRAKYAELLEVHQMLDLTELEQPSMRFTKNVMEEIAKYNIAPATKSYINTKIIWSIGLFFITLIVGLVIYGVAQIDWSAGGQTQNPIGVDFTAVDYSPIFSNTFVNIFMMANVILGLMLLDRVLSKKKQALQKEI